MIKKYGLFLLILILFFPSFVYSAKTGKQIVSNDIFSAHYRSGSRCMPLLDLVVKAPSIKYFKDMSQLEQFLKIVRKTLDAECGPMRGMKIWGTVNGARVYQANYNQHQGWRLISAYPDRFEYTPKINIKSAASRAPKSGLFDGKDLENQPKLSAQRDDFSVTLFKNNQPNASLAPLRLIAIRNNRNGARTNFGFTGNGYASCAELMSIRAHAYSHLLDFDEFRKTGRGHDLPAEVIDGYYLMRDALLEICPELKVLRVKFESMNGDRTVSYEGTITADSGWDLMDGTVRTEYDATREVRIKYRDIHKPAGIDYKGTCEPSPLLPLKPIYYNNADKAFAKPLTMFDYEYTAKTVAKIYKKECPGVKDIRFSCNPMPQSYICVDDGPCYLTWSADNPGHIDSSQMKLKPMLRDYNDVIKAFARGDKKLLDEYRKFVQLFHNDWLEMYSENCRSSIRNPKGFTVKTIETRYNQDGFEESSRQIGETQEVFVDRDYADRFERFFGPNQAWGALLLMNRVANTGSGHFSPKAVTRSIRYFINNRKQIERFMSGNCNSEAVQTVYKNLDRYYTSQSMKTIDLDKVSKKKHPDTRVKRPPAENPGSSAKNTGPQMMPKPAAEPPVKKKPVLKPERFVNSTASFKTDFPSDLALTPLINDFLLARYYPKKLSNRMLEAMMSSRWSYEKNETNPLGGRFFTPDKRPQYKDVQALNSIFRGWLISRAENLPEQMILEVPLQYGANTLTVKNQCIKLIVPPDAPKPVSQAEKNKADRKIRQCEAQNRRLEKQFINCEKARNNLSQAKEKLARLNADGCGQTNDSQESPSKKGPCDFPSDMTIATMQTEMMNCMTKACGTPSATSDMVAYQQCVQAVSEQIRNEINRQMGQTQTRHGASDPCSLKEKEIQTLERHIAQRKCDAMTEKPEPMDCASLSVTRPPVHMPVERIEFSQTHSCVRWAYIFNRTTRAAGELLPNGQPFSDTNYGVTLSMDKLTFPYDLPVQSNRQWAAVNARIKITLKIIDDQLSKQNQMGLKAYVKGIEYKKM